MKTTSSSAEPLHNTSNQSELPPPTKNGWLYIYSSFAVLALIVFVLTSIYRDTPRRTGVIDKRPMAPVQGVYTVVLSPVDSATANKFIQYLTQTIGKDSARTKMVVSSTAMFKRCTSFSDYKQIVYNALLQARPRNSETQSQLLSQISKSCVTDRLFSTLYLVGALGDDSYEAVEHNLGTAIAELQLRNQTIGPLQVHSWLMAAPNSPVANVHQQFLNDLRKRKFTVAEQN